MIIIQAKLLIKCVAIAQNTIERNIMLAERG